MENNIIDLIASGNSVDASSEIKNLLMQKAVKRIETIRPEIVSRMFDLDEPMEEEE